MKRFIIFLFLTTLFTSMTFAQDEFFEKYSDKKGVSVTFISKSMFSRMSGGKVEGGKLKDIEWVRVLSVENRAMVAQVKADVLNEFSSSNGYEEQMRVQENGETTIIKRFVSKKKQCVLLLVVYDSLSIEVVMIAGKDLSISDIRKVK